MIAVPTFFCPKLWEDMTGDETGRFCSKCQKTVHNIASLSLDQRIALMRAPKGSICGRYQIAVRRAIKGHEESYMRHLVKYGAGVAASSAVFITLWQLYDDAHRENPRPAFRVGSPTLGADCELAEEFFEEETYPTLGIFMMPEKPPAVFEKAGTSVTQPTHVDITFVPVELDKLLKKPELPELTFPLIIPSNGSAQTKPNKI